MKINKAIIIIDDYIKEFYKKPKYRKETDILDYKRKRYANWAAITIRTHIDLNRDWEPICALEDIRHTFDEIACEAKCSEDNFRFSIAYDVASDLLDQLILEV